MQPIMPQLVNCEACQVPMIDSGQTKCSRCSKDYEDGADEQTLRNLYELKGFDWMIETIMKIKKENNG